MAIRFSKVLMTGTGGSNLRTFGPSVLLFGLLMLLPGDATAEMQRAATHECRVGMSTHPDVRMWYWKRVEGYTKGIVLHDNLTYDEARAAVEREARKAGCKQQAVGRRVQGKAWSIYKVWRPEG